MVCRDALRGCYLACENLYSTVLRKTSNSLSGSILITMQHRVFLARWFRILNYAVIASVFIFATSVTFVIIFQVRRTESNSDSLGVTWVPKDIVAKSCPRGEVICSVTLSLGTTISI